MPTIVSISFRFSIIIIVFHIFFKGTIIGQCRPEGHRDSDEEHVEEHRSSIEFQYKEPDYEWTRDFYSCNGERQSPVNIDLQNLKYSNIGVIKLIGYENPPKVMTMSNTGHGIQIKGIWPDGETPYINGGPLKGAYELIQLHFHWGANNSVGSEHTVSNHSFPMEMHMVHWKRSYGSFKDAIKYDDGLAVIAYLLSPSENSNMGLEMIRLTLHNVKEPHQDAIITPFALTLLNLDFTKEGYITYPGSLTTPPCIESVIWIIAAPIKEVTNRELAAFRKVKLNNDDGHNFRPVQDLNGRQLYHADSPI